MKNNQAKEDAIKEAYGENYDLCKPYFQKSGNGWIDIENLSYHSIPLSFPNGVETDCEYWRPNGLQGIEDNNGWVRIEHDGSNLPSDYSTSTYESYNIRIRRHYPNYNAEELRAAFHRKSVTHYKLKIVNTPIY